MSRLDPKPGRWILPLAVAGIVGFTWVFVNALPAQEEETVDAAATTTEAPEPDATTTTARVPDATTTTTTPPEIAQFLLAADTVSTTAQDLLTEAQDINQTWEDGRNFTLALNSLRDFADKVGDFAQGIDDTTVPTQVGDSWDPVRSAAGDMITAADDMVTGLQSSDTGQIRRAALGDFDTAVSALTDAVEAAVQAAS